MKKRNIFLVITACILLSAATYVRYHNLNVNDIGLGVLTLIKSVKGEAVNLEMIQKDNTPIIEHKDWTTLLQNHVTRDGVVNYQGFIKDSLLFNNYLRHLSQHPPGKNWSKQAQLAYWINAYNAFTVKLIIDHLPLKSIKDISDGLPMINSPWDIKFFKIKSVAFDLNTIEHEILRKIFQEPRIHFAINCASFSCPKLRNEAYTAGKLEQQLSTQTRGFLNDPTKNIINENETKLSKIFDWFQSDFIKNTDLLSFIRSYKPNINPSQEIEYLEYDWTLNDK